MVNLPGILEWFYLVTSGSSLSEHQNCSDSSFCQSPQDSHLGGIEESCKGEGQ